MNKQKRLRLISLLSAVLLLPVFSAALATEADVEQKPTLTLIGHASVKIRTTEGVVIYIDPYYAGDYREEADIILVSHEHGDHNKVSLCKQKAGCVVLRVSDTINKKDATYNTFEIAGVTIQPVPAANKNHKVNSSTGFVLTFDGLRVYHAGDTSKLSQMADLQAMNIDYALFPIDGKYNMNAAEAMECAAVIGARHNTPMHYFEADPAAFTPENLLLIPYGETVALEKGTE